MPLNKVLESLDEYLRYQIEEGVAGEPVDAEVIAELGKVQERTAGHAIPPVVTREMTSLQKEDSTAANVGLAKIAKTITGCTKCPLHTGRTNTVPGQGALRPEVMFVGEGPGADEDQQGVAFVGRAGKLLTKMIVAMGYTREEVFIGNIVKCRPPGNRVPLPEEMAACMPYLKQQIALLQPRVIVALGATAVKGLLGTKTGITTLRGVWHSFEGIDVMPTFHPAYLLRNPSAKKPTWEDLKTVLARVGRTPPAA